MILVPATCVLVAAFVLRPAKRWEDGDIILRGDAPRAAFTLHSARPVEPGSEDVTLAWAPRAGATGYQVRIFDASMDPLYRSDILPDTTYTVTRSAIAQDGAAQAPFAWRVAAYKGTREIGLSDIATIRLP